MAAELLTTENLKTASPEALRAELVAVNDALDEFGAQHHPEPVSLSACVEEAMMTLRLGIAQARRDLAKERERADAAEAELERLRTGVPR